jgi:hypothetical protein
MKTLLYYFGLIQWLLFVQVFVFKTKTYYEDDCKQNKRLRGGAVIVTNHRSFADAIVIALRFFFKRLHFIVGDFNKKKRNIVLRFLIGLLKCLISVAGGIFVDKRGYSLDFIEKSKRIAAKGRPILIFPEGDFSFAYEPSKFYAGYIMLAIQTGAKIIPVVNDFNYGLFKRVHLLVGTGIDLSGYSAGEFTKERINEINDEIGKKFLRLYYLLKRKIADRLSFTYDFVSPEAGDVIRIEAGSHHHYGVYLSAGEVVQFGRAVNRTAAGAVVNSVPLKEFCGDKIPEVRTRKGRVKRLTRKAAEIESYAKSCLGQGGYSLAENNCLDFANRITLNI